MTNGEMNWSSTTGAILMVSLMLFSTWIQVIDNETTLDEAPVARFLTASDTLSYDTQTNSSQPSNNYGSATNLQITDYPQYTDARMLANFPLTLNDGGVLPTTAVVSKATLDLTCRKSVAWMDTSNTALYPARLLTDFDEANATHNLSDTGTPWNVTGVEGVGVDRGLWEPGAHDTVSSVEVFTLNLTSLVQDALRNGESNISIIISGVGAPVHCTSSEGASGDAPSIDFEYTLGTAPAQGSVLIEGPEDGTILADQSDLLIMPDYSPTISWDNLTAGHIEVQFSSGPDFRFDQDESRTWNSWDDSSDFSMSSEEFYTPENDADLLNGTWVYFRMRSVNNSILGPWESGYFGLPAEIGSLNGQGQAEILLRNDSVNLGFGTVHDTWVMDGNTSYNGNDDFRMRIGHSNDSTEGNMHAFIRVNMEQVPIHDNITIHEATLNLRRTDRTGEPFISVLMMDSNTGHVFSELNYDNSSNGVPWSSGGAIVSNPQEALLETRNGNQSGTSMLEFDATSFVQSYLQNGHTGDLDFLVMSQGLAGEEIEIATGDEPFSYRPHLEITYSWGDSIATSDADVLTPAPGSAAWDVVSWELESTTTPTITWDPSVVTNSNGNAADVILQLFPEGFGDSIPLTVDSRSDGGFDLANGEYTIPSSWNLDWGHAYEWRMLMIEDDEQGSWSASSFLISEVNSTSLGGGEHELRYRHGNGTSQSLKELPDCSDLTIEGGLASNMNLDGQDITASDNQVILLGCDLSSHAMPDGLAIVSATMRIRTLQQSGISSFAIPMTMYESGEHDWEEGDATWNTTDGSTPWNAPGASGTERVQSLDTTDIDADNTWYEWNVTAAVQSAMRTDSQVDFILTSDSWQAVSFFDRGSGSMPELVIVYTNGSNAAPNVPIDMSPANGDWILSGDYTFAVDQTPTLSWNETGVTAANAWQVQVDGDSTFSSSSLLTFSSWIDTSSFSGTSFTFANDLGAGEEFYWRARGISASGQIGLWSAGTSFVIPDLDVTQIDSSTYQVDMGHGDILSDGSMPLFTDTWISWTSAALNDTHADEDTLFISGWSSVLIEIPIDGPGALPHPSGARLVGAAIDFQVSTNNSSTPTIAIHETLKDWDESATGRTYDGSTNWSSLGGYGLLDRSDWVDVAYDPASSNRMNMDITEIVQAAIARGDDSVGLMLSVEQFSSDQIVLASTETQFDANEPEIQLKWTSGTGTVPSQAATIVSPANGDILWDFPAMSANDSPTASWSHPAASTVTDWRLFSYDTNDGPWGGVVVTDSRTCATCSFDMTNMTVTDSALVLDQDNRYSWMVQPIQDGMYGPRSAIEDFIVPNDMGAAINSTDYWASMANGNAYSATGTYDIAQGAYIDSCNPNSAYGNTANNLNIGASNGGPACTNAGHESRSLLRFDVSNVPLMDNNPWQVLEAHVEMYRIGGSSSYNTPISVSNVHCSWIEANVTWNSCATNNSWQVAGANGANDADMPISTTDVSSNSWYSWDVTNLMQYARSSGSDTLNLLFSSEDSNLYARHSFIQEDATGVYQSFRPALNITYRAGTQSVTSAPSWDASLTTNSPFTAWDSSALRPSPQDPLSSTWTHPSSSTIDTWQVQYAANNRFTEDTSLIDSSDSSTWGNITFDLSNFSMNVPPADVMGDNWHHLRIRAIQDGVYSNWSTPFQARVPEEQGSDDGAGNYTVTMQRGAVFEDTGLLPTMPDSYVTSNTFGQTTNYGSSTTMAVGLDPADTAHDAIGLVSVDLAEYPYPATMLPTSVTLRMYVASVAGTGAHSIAIHDCSGFTESTVSWNNYNPNTQCNSTASSSMTSTTTASGVWYEWDVTSIARSAWAGSGVMNMGLQTGWGGTVYFNSAEGSSAYAPELVVDYVDNPNNASSPAQVSLISPEQLEVVYSVGQYTLGIESRPVLSWDTLGDATGYVLILSNGSGSQTYSSWDSNSNSGFNIGSTAATASTWTPGFDLATGEIYTWSVQALNGSVPGPRSVPWTFGIGNPDITFQGNHVYSIEIQEGSDIETLGHVPIWDTYMSEGAIDTAHGASDTLQIGTGCDSAASNRCYGLYEIDMGQMGPLGQLPVNTHSAQLSIYSDGISEFSAANYLDLTAYALINPNYEESGATWNSAATGVNWTAYGLQSGTDYIATPLDTVRVMSNFVGGWLYFDVSGAMTTMNGTVSIVIMGVPNAGHMLIDVKTSESVSSNKPMLHFNYTLVDSISLTGPTTTDADTGVQFAGALLDASANTLAGDVIWSCSSGSIDASGFFTPDQTGIVGISAAYGQVVETVNLTVTAGTPTILVVVPLAITLTADDTFDMNMLAVLDANGNVVPGEIITMTITNGTFSQGVIYNSVSMDYSVTTPAGAVSWLPWTAGTQWMNVTWGTQSVSIEITVETGVPSYFIITGDSMVEAGNTTTFDIDIYDQKGNQKDRSTSGTLTWGAENGAMDNATGLLTGDQIGTWNVWVDSDLGIHSDSSIDVTYGAIAELEVTAIGPINTIIVTSSPTLDSISLTADDSVTLNVIRIDVQGNRESIDLPIAGWSWLNGLVNAGFPTTWDAANQGSSWVKATLEGFDVVIPMAVDHGLPVTIEARAPNDDFNLISGQDTGTLSAFTADSDGNEWSVSATWTTADSSASDWLTPQGTSAIFEAVQVGDWTVNVLYVFSVPGVGEQSVFNDATFTVTAGALNSISLSNDVTITSDDSFDLSPDARDGHGNDLPEDPIQWLQWDSTTVNAPQTCSAAVSGWTDISIDMRADNYVWTPDETTPVGEYTICAAGESNVQSLAVVTVTVGEVANVWHKAYSTFDESGDIVVQAQTRITSGDFPIVEIWVADADGNQYQTTLVSWGSDTEGFTLDDISDANTNPLVDIGNYRFDGRINQVYELTYSAGSCATCSGTWNITVDYGQLHRLEATASSPGTLSGTTLTVDQQAMVTIDVEGFDQFGNSVPIQVTDAFDSTQDSLNVVQSENFNETSASIYMLNEGVNDITICADGLLPTDKNVCDQVQISVESTIAGFFESNAPWSWIGLAALAALLIGVVLVVVVLMRRGDSDDEYDDDLYDDEEEYDAPAAAVPVAETQAATEEEYNAEEDPNYRVDEDGTEWWEDDSGVWWYREPDMDDWVEWTE
ncbi:MAG: DNRLRE domain-containing protein [Candidatus Thalassarchaeaceae archaeon]|nr:DNRLRE domain-containing protein [Candidatus Thalassarchaeaceae archaeon]